MSWQDDWRISSGKELLLALAVLAFVFVIAVWPLAFVVHTGGRLLGLWGAWPPVHEILLSALFVPYLAYLWRDNPVVRLVVGVLAVLAAVGGAGWGTWWLVRDPAAALPWLGRGLVGLGILLVVGLAALVAAALLTGRIRARRVRALARAARAAGDSLRAERRGKRIARTILGLGGPGYEDAVDGRPELMDAAREEGPLREACLDVLARYAAPDPELLRLITAHLRRDDARQVRQAWIGWAEERERAGEDEEAWRRVFRDARLRLGRTSVGHRRLVLDALRSGPAPWERFGRRFEGNVEALSPEGRDALESAAITWLERGLEEGGRRDRYLSGTRRSLPG